MYRSQVSSMYNVLHNTSPQHFCRKVAILYVQSSIYRLAGPSPFRIFKNKISLNLRKNVKFNQTIVLKDQLPANYFGFRFFFFFVHFFSPDNSDVTFFGCPSFPVTFCQMPDYTFIFTCFHYAISSWWVFLLF